jgi:hypothetical protein
MGQESQELSCPVPRLSFGNVRRHRDRRTPHLRRQSKSLLRRKALGEMINGLRKRYSLLPNKQFLVMPRLGRYRRGGSSRLLARHSSLATRHFCLVGLRVLNVAGGVAVNRFLVLGRERPAEFSRVTHEQAPRRDDGVLGHERARGDD